MNSSAGRRRNYGVCAAALAVVLCVIGLLRAGDSTATWVAAALAWAGCAVVLLTTAGRTDGR